MKRWHLFASFCTALTLLAGCASLDERQRAWIFQPSDRSWSGGAAAAEGMDDVWIDFNPKISGHSARLHGLWLAADRPEVAKAPVLLYLHGARYNVTGSAPHMRRMQALGFSVLAIDYRGFGKSTEALPSEASAYEDARAAWDWLAQKYPDRPRYIFGHSLGGPIAINLATEVADESGTIVESTFTSIADVVSNSRWGWLPVSLLITQRFEAVRKVDKIGSPLLVVHGDEDRTVAPELGRKLFDAAVQPKLFMLVQGGSHHNANVVGQPQYRQALAQLFHL
ncbi:MAG: alpha/beta fold hydrolase [Polaromonas sp.]|nr:alpha/beta fold hydrolase [Polaromonas sp.]